MTKNIMIISADYTGHGHKSIAEALGEEFTKYSSLVKVHIVNGFHLGGMKGKIIERAYSPTIRHAKYLWKICYELCDKYPTKINSYMVSNIEKRFLEKVQEIKPDLIVSVHAGFVGSILDIMEKHNINIPFVTILADLVSFSTLWADKRADFTICPTEEAVRKMMELEIPENKIMVTGFPVRKRFTNALLKEKDNKVSKNEKTNILLVNGCEKRNRIIRITKHIMNNTNCNLTIITGRDNKLRSRLSRTVVRKYSDRISLNGYVTNMEYFMSNCDLMITKGGPNILMEAINCCIPVVVTGVLPGQEEKNSDFIVENGLGLFCDRVQDLPEVINRLLVNNKEKLNEIKQKQCEFRKPTAVGEIVEHLLKVVGD